MTIGANDVAGGAEGGFSADWEAVRSNADTQFGLIQSPPPPETPEWLKALGRFLSQIFSPLGDALAAVGHVLGVSSTALLWVLGAIGVALAALLIWRLASPALAERSGEKAEPDAGWVPDAAAARDLLAEADRLAADGRYEEATHLLLIRSVEQIEAARPDLLEPSSTAREIAVLPVLSEAARQAFATIAQRVERSLFAVARLSAEDWQAARTAYAEFALAGPGAQA